MTGGSRIAAVGPEKERPESQDRSRADEAREAEYVGDEMLALEEEWEEGGRQSRHRGWVMPLLAVLAIAAWTAFFVVAHQSEIFSGGTLEEWSGWVTAWAVPVLLVLAVWLIAMRSSSREAARFGDVSRMLSDESARLEKRLITVNRELSLAREFIAAQARDLESLGRVASDRLSQNADRLSGLVNDNVAQIESIATVSGTALENMDKLRGELPVIANSARDVTSQIGNAGRTAQAQLDELVSGLHRLNEFGEASERQVESLKQKVDATLGDFASQSANIGNIESSALASLQQRLSTLRDETAALDAELAARADNIMHAIDERREAHRAQIAEATDDLEGRLADLDALIARRQEEQLTHVSDLTLRGDVLAEKVGELGSAMESIATRGGRAGDELANAVELFTSRLSANRDLLKTTEEAVAGLTDSSVRLLELIQAGSQHSREQLPEAIAFAGDHLGILEDRVRALGPLLGEASDKGQELSEYVLAAQQTGRSSLEELDALHQRLAERDEVHTRQIEALRSSLTALSEESEKLSERVQGELTEAVERLKSALGEAVEELGSGHHEAIDSLAGRIGQQSAEAIERSIRNHGAEAIGELEQAAAHASGVSREAARQLRDQLAMVDELAGNLESRVTRARERAEEQVDNDFARRVALITESLNSHSIDISKALSNDVTDSAWASYLRGDRGIFTRRAVRLLDNSEAREVAEIYDRDADFREHVSRYIHDFEGMLRTLLSTRDGKALGVTLLSSDMGKLYVALAQAIERLRD